MDLDVTIAVATFGDSHWEDLARSRAIPSAETFGVPVVYVHLPDGGLHDARNAALAQIRTEWVVHLDADDELEPGYLDALARGAADVRAPAVRYVRNGHHQAARVPKVSGHPHGCTAHCLPEGNWLVVGSLVRADLVRQVGGWRDFPWSEDWDLWLRCWRAGATFQPVPKAVYRAHVRPDSRNRGQSQEARNAAHKAIHRANFPEVYARR